MSKNIFITQGGCGTESLMGILKPHIVDDIHRHERNPEEVLKYPNSRILYIFPNPYDLILSSCGRKFGSDSFLYYHASNLVSYVSDEDNKFRQLCETKGHPQGNAEEVLKIYLELNQDILGLENHYKNWRNDKNRNYSIRFVKYEGLCNHGIELFNEWWDINIPPDKWLFKKRKADYTKLNKDLFSKLESMYGDWFEQYQSLPLIEDVYPEKVVV